MLEQLTLSSFSDHLNSTFRVIPDPGPALELELIEAQDRGSTPALEQFSLTFRGPLHTFLPQRLYAMEHNALGSLDLFMVPIGRYDDGFRYQAVFNRFR